MRKRQYYLFPLLLFALPSSAQYIQVNDNYTAQQLVNALVDNSCAQVSNIMISGFQGGQGPSYGYFTAGTSAFPFANGIVLSTGYASSAPGPNGSLLSEGSTGWSGDIDLEQALGISNTINATILEFDFIPFTDKISFDYIFSSEQYLTSITSQNQCNYTDGFAFLIKKANTGEPYQNLAVVPGTDIPVKVNTVRGEGVCPTANPQYFDSFNEFEHPTNFNGQTKILKAQSNVEPGTLYHIKLVVADQGNNLYDSAIFLGGGSFTSATELGTNRLIATDNPVCEGEALLLNAFNPIAMGYRWYKNGVLIQGETQANYSVVTPGEYKVSVQLSPTCFSTGEITIEYSALPPSGNHTLLQCDEDADGITLFNLNLAVGMITNNNAQLQVLFFPSVEDANSGTNNITNLTAYQNTIANQRVYARVTNQYGCSSISIVTLSTSVNGLTNPAPIPLCDEDGSNDGKTAFNLSAVTPQILQNLPAGLEVQYFLTASDALSAVNPIVNPSGFVNTVPGGQTIYARVYNASDCYGIAQFDIIVNAFDDPGAITAILCEGDSVMLDAGEGYPFYEWDTIPVQNDRFFTVNQPGNYKVILIDENGCNGSKVFNVIPSGPAHGAIFNVNDFTGSDNSITVLPQGIGNYEFSLDGIHYQDSNIFEHLVTGEYTVYINDKNGCGLYSDSVFVLDYPRFFTPNNDGISDVWRIPYLSLFPQSRITIFDRYGKVLAIFNGNATGWDGTYNGLPLPSTDYWFMIEMESGRKVRGHFAMIR